MQPQFAKAEGSEPVNRVNVSFGFCVAVIPILAVLLMLALSGQFRSATVSFLSSNGTSVGVGLALLSVCVFGGGVFSRDAVLTNPLAFPLTQIVGRPVVRLVIIWGSIFGMATGVDLALDGVSRSVYQCGSAGTYSTVDQDGDCICRNGYSWQDDGDSGNFFCEKSQ